MAQNPLNKISGTVGIANAAADSDPIDCLEQTLSGIVTPAVLTNSFTMGTWIAAVAASKNVNVGINENVWLKGADNGVTNTYDGIHYSGAGETACAAQWKAVLGL